MARDGQITAAHIATVADVFNISIAEVRGIVGFYSDLSTGPSAIKTIRICQAEACQAVGARQLTGAVESALGLAIGQTAEDQSVALEAVYCLGICACGPAATVDGCIVARAAAGDLVS